MKYKINVPGQMTSHSLKVANFVFPNLPSSLKNSHTVLKGGNKRCTGRAQSPSHGSNVDTLEKGTGEGGNGWSYFTNMLVLEGEAHTHRFRYEINLTDELV